MESWQTQPLLLLKIGSYTELQVVADGTQNFESDCFIANKLIAFAGETTDVEATNTSPKISNLFFIFPLSFRFLFFVDHGPIFFGCDHKNFYSITYGVGEKLPHKTPPYTFLLGNKNEKFRFIPTSQQHF